MTAMNRDQAWLAGVLALFALLLAAAVQQRLAAGGPEHGSIRSAAPDGAQRLAAQLGGWGYAVLPLDEAPLLIPNTAAALLVIGGGAPYGPLEANQIVDWVAAGGTLLVAQDDARGDSLLAPFGITLRRRWRRVDQAPLRLPIFNWPPVGSVTLRAQHQVAVPCGQAAIHLGDCDAPLLVVFGHGRGQVVVLASIFPLTNAGLLEPGNLQFAANLVDSMLPRGAAIAVDEAHRRAAGLPRGWLLTTPEGLSALYAASLLLAYAWWQGRTLQTAVPDAPDADAAPIQTPDEFIADMSKLYQQGGQEKGIQHHYWQRLKRQLARKYRGDATLPDAAFLAELAPHAAEVDMAMLIALQADLQRPQISEMQLVWWVTRVIDLTEALEARH